jgi:hypothetical protein
MNTYGGGCIDPHSFYLGTSWKWVVIFTSRPLYPRGKSPWFPLDRRLGGPQNRSGRHGEKKILAPTGTRTPTSGRPARSQSLYRLSYPGSLCMFRAIQNVVMISVRLSQDSPLAADLCRVFHEDMTDFKLVRSHFIRIWNSSIFAQSKNCGARETAVAGERLWNNIRF